MSALQIIILSVLVTLSFQLPGRDYSKPQISSFASPFAPPMPGSALAEFANTQKKGPIGNVIANAKGEGGNVAANGYSEVGGSVQSNAVNGPPPGYQA